MSDSSKYYHDESGLLVKFLEVNRKTESKGNVNKITLLSSIECEGIAIPPFLMEFILLGLIVKQGEENMT